MTFFMLGAFNDQIILPSESTASHMEWIPIMKARALILAGIIEGEGGGE